MYGCIGEHLRHSFSKDIHEKIASYSYRLIELSPNELGDFLENRKFDGINVTIPYKQAVIPYLSHISDTAKSIGAVNTIVNKNGLLCGYNTDFGGMKALIEKNGIELKNKKVLILGTGGTSKTATAVAGALGAREIYRVSRSANEGAVTYDEAYSLHGDAGVIINTTPCGMFPNTDGMPIDVCSFKNLEAVVDAIYNPLCSRLVLSAKKKGIKATGGLYMLVAQAVIAAEIFTGRSFGAEITDKIYNEILRSKQNIVLVGMPGSGKTTVGKMLSSRLGMKFVDTDELIKKSFGMEIGDIFETYGEKKFRDAESEIIKRISNEGGSIVSTGGGAVLREENVDALHLNGRIFFLDRPLGALIPTSDRPLANSADKIKSLYELRYPVYKAAADDVINIDFDENGVADAIESRWGR